MSSKVTSIGLKGLQGYLITVEVQTIPGMHSIVIVGLPDASVKEAKQRMTAAFHSLHYFLYKQKIIINLSPAEQKKNGPMYDLPMAVGILLSMQELSVSIPETTGFFGALSLDGSILPVEGMLPAVLAAKRLGIKKLYLPFDEQLPMFEIEDLELIFVHHLKEVLQHLNGKSLPTMKRNKTEDQSLPDYYIDFRQIIGHSYAKRALEVAAAGEHHVLMTGPPGCGKSLLAQSFPSILPTLSKEFQLEMMSIYQLAGLLNQHPMYPPFRTPHHSSSSVSIVGGGQNPKPGEISLAHRGVLFLDEIAEFPKKTLEMLRQPIEAGMITISRVHATVSYPSAFVLLGAMNPCPCGYLGSNHHYCICSPKQIAAYQNRLSGPIRDRFDIFLSLRPVDIKISMDLQQESSQNVRERVADARLRQMNRYGKAICNGRVPYEILLQTSPLSKRQLQFLRQLAMKQDWSNRAYIKIHRLSRTIADLQQSHEISDQNIWEAIQLHTAKYFQNQLIGEKGTSVSMAALN